MLSNSLVAGVLAACYVLALLLQLNPTLPLHPARLVPLAATIGLFYAVHLTVVFYVLLVVRQLLARELFSPAWISVGVLAWLGAAAAAAGAALMWGNLHTFTIVLEPTTVNEIAKGMLSLVASASLFAVVALLRAHFWPRQRATCALLLVSVAAGSVLAPLVLRGRGAVPVLEAHPIDVTLDIGTTERPARVTVVAIDAGSLDFITSATAEGRLPNFGRILDAGAVMHLATLHPTSAAAVWAAVATGKLPQKNGVRSAGVYRLAGGGGSVQLLPDYCFAHGLERFGFLVEEAHTSATFRTRTLWSILSTNGFSVGVVGWPLTQPAPAVRGYLVSDTYHRVALTASGIDEPSAIYPPELQLDALAAMESATTDAPPVVMVSLGGAGGSGADTRQETPARTDRVYDRIAQAMARGRPAQVTLTRYQGLDPIGHYFLRYAVPSEFGDVTDE